MYSDTYAMRCCKVFNDLSITKFLLVAESDMKKKLKIGQSLQKLR